MRRWFALPAVLLLLMLPLAAQDASAPAPVASLIPEVLNVYPHDTTAFTQGLLYHEGKLYESTGLAGQSSLREVEIETGAVLRRVEVRRAESDMADGGGDYFAEGLTLVGDSLIQLTWTHEKAFVYDLATFEEQALFTYEGEGWGLCDVDEFVYMTDSTNSVSLRRADDFELIVKFLVTLNGQPLALNLLNELECVGDHLYANLWQTDFIVQIDRFTGQVTAVIDGRNLLTAEERAALTSSQVLNGIAYNPETDTFYITGKQWPKLFEVRFVPAPAATPAPAMTPTPRP